MRYPDPLESGQLQGSSASDGQQTILTRSPVGPFMPLASASVVERPEDAAVSYGALRCSHRFVIKLCIPGFQTLPASENAPAANTLAPAGVS